MIVWESWRLMCSETNALYHRRKVQQLLARILLLQAVSGYENAHEVLHVTCDVQQLLNLRCCKQGCVYSCRRGAVKAQGQRRWCRCPKNAGELTAAEVNDIQGAPARGEARKANQGAA